MIAVRCSLFVTALAAASGCSSDFEDSESAGGSASGDPSADRDNNGGGETPEPGPDDGEYVPEVEERFEFQAPRSSQNFIFVANSTLDSVSKINASTLEIISVETGDRPTLIDTHRGENLAVVLNEGSNELTIIRAGDNDDDYVRNVPIPVGMNQLALTPGGDYALAWFDFGRAERDAEFRLDEVAPPFQDVALVDLTEGEEKMHNLTVGFQVLEVEFDADGHRAFVITRTGVSVVDLATIDGDRAIPPVAVTDGEPDDETDREVEITSDGQFAFVRSAGLEGINVVDLVEGEVNLVALNDVPTDLDIVPGTHRATSAAAHALTV